MSHLMKVNYNGSFRMLEQLTNTLYLKPGQFHYSQAGSMKLPLHISSTMNDLHQQFLFQLSL